MEWEKIAERKVLKNEISMSIPVRLRIFSIGK